MIFHEKKRKTRIIFTHFIGILNGLSIRIKSVLQTLSDKWIEASLIRKFRKITIDRINVGCGDNFIEGWLNIGIFPKTFIPYGSILKNDRRALILHFDMTKRFPIPENTIQELYASHFIEHLSFEDGFKFLKRCYRIMKKEGVIRLTFPDMELWIKKYCENDMDFFKKYKSIYSELLPSRQLSTKGAIFMSQVYGHGHKWNYDFETMKDIMERTGFSDVTRKNAFESLISDIKKLEPNDEGRLLETAYIEAIKL